MREISADDELASLSEFTFLRENAKQADATGPLPTVERIDSGAVSALKFGDAAPRVVFLHGGGQNAHTWDTVIVGPRRARAGRRPARARSLGMARGRRLRPQAQRHHGRAPRTRARARCRPRRRDVTGRADSAAAGGDGARTRPQAGPRRRDAVGTGTAHRDDRRAEGHRRAGTGRADLPELRRHAGGHRRGRTAP